MAKIIYSTTLIEIITVTGRNRLLKFQSNRPLLLSKGLKNRRINWKLVDGILTNSHVLDTIIKSLEAHLKEKLNL